MAIEVGVRRRPCRTMTDSAPSGGGSDEQQERTRSVKASDLKRCLLVMRANGGSTGLFLYPRAAVSASMHSSKLLVVTVIGAPTSTSIVEKGIGCIFRSHESVRKQRFAEMRTGRIGTPL
jgi:hypothetical protein